MREIEESSMRLNAKGRMVMNDVLEMLAYLFTREREMEDQIASAVRDDRNVKLLMTIPDINVHSAVVIISGIDSTARFHSKEKFASCFGLVPRQDKSGSRDIGGHTSKRGPSMLRFVLVTASHTAVKRSNMLRLEYLSVARRLGLKSAVDVIT